MNFTTIINKNNLYAFIKTARDNSLSSLFYRCKQYIQDAIIYPQWYQNHVPSDTELSAQQNTLFDYSPLISIVVPTYCTPTPFLHEMIQSVRNQTYSNWELCIADASPSNSNISSILDQYMAKDSRIHVTYLEKNEGISANTNKALALTHGEYICLLDHDDLLAPNALFEIVSAVSKDCTIDVLYTDEDKITDNSSVHYYPTFKPDYNRALLWSCNYICHLFVFKRAIYESVGNFNSAYDGSQDYDYILRCTRSAKHVHHIPKMLYHWRVHPGSVASSPQQKSYCYEAARQALEEDLQHHNINNGSVSFSDMIGYYNTRFELPSDKSVLIITQNRNLTYFQNEHVTVIHLDSIQNITHILENHSCAFCLFLDAKIDTINDTVIADTISNLQYETNGAVTYKITHHSRILCLGMTLSDNSLCGCYYNTPCSDAGYHGRAAINQYVPLCSPIAFASRKSTLLDYFNSQKLYSITNWNDFVIDYSYYINDKHMHILGLSNTIIEYPSRKLPQLSNTYKLTDTFSSFHSGGLYKIPPYDIK